MSRIPTPNYVLDSDHSYSTGLYDTRVLPAGTFVRPIELCYVPKHILDSDAHKWFNKETDVYVYTRYGIVSVPKKIVRRT